jgi:ribosomal protein S18 acetylase RimI-like enzyme
MTDVVIYRVTKENVFFLQFLHHELLATQYPEFVYEQICLGHGMAGFLACCDGQVVGEITMEWKEKHGYLRVYIPTLSIVEERRRKGIATQLLSHVKELSKNAQHLTLHTEENNFAAQSLYEKKGFIANRRIAMYYIPENLDAIKYKWTRPCQSDPIEHSEVSGKYRLDAQPLLLSSGDPQLPAGGGNARIKLSV